MTPIRQTLADIAGCATPASFRPATPIPGEHPAMPAIAAGQVVAELAPFAALWSALVAFFNGTDPAAALDGPDSAEAEAEIRRIIGEHLAAAAARIVARSSSPAQDWTNREALLRLATAATMHASDLRFVSMLPG